MKSMFAAGIAFCLIVPAALAAPPRHMIWTVDGQQREALVYEPEANSHSGLHPLIFAFHGHGGGMDGFSQVADLHDAWPQAIVVYPQGLPTTSRRDPEGRKPGWQRLEGDDGDRDLKFFDAMLASMRHDYRVDDRHVFATGFSNGAFFSYLLWAERSDVFAGFAIVAGALEPQQTLPVARPVLHVAGRRDALVTPEKVNATVVKERDADGAQGQGEACGEGCTLFHGQGADVEVAWHSGKHVYPPMAAQQTVAFFKGLQARKR